MTERSNEPAEKALIEDLPAIREQLQEHWQKAALDLVSRGFRPEAVFDTLITVGLAGWVEVYGKAAAAEKLLPVVQKLADQVRVEQEAMQEASRATKN
jgi:hypothetical protein